MSERKSNVPPAVLHARREVVFLALAGLFLGTLAMLNILGISRFIRLGELPDWLGGWTVAVAVGVLPYPLTFLCTDIISEFYGRKRANRVVWVGLLLNLWVMGVLWLGGALPGFSPVDPQTGYPPRDAQDWAYFKIQHLAFGAVTASMIAYMAAQFCDVYLFHFWKRLTRGKHLWVRNNGSTMVSQIVDTVAVILITHYYAHALPVEETEPILPQLLMFMASSYVFKFIAALLDTPVIYVVVHYLKGYLQLDPTAEHAADVEEARLFSLPPGEVA